MRCCTKMPAARRRVGSATDTSVTPEPVPTRGWSIGSFRRKAKRGEREAGQSWFFYKDKGSALLAHKLILAECGPSRTWVIIQEVTKVLKENEATSLLHSVQGSNYARHYKRRMGDVRGSRAGDIRACDCVADRRCLSDSEVLSSIHT